MIRTASLGVVSPQAARWPLLDAVRAEQQQLTAVERFTRQHDEGVPTHAKLYKNLLPATPPGPGQQYAFEVDLDACTGCKACVAACHNLNGLDEGEVWRTVGLLHGGTPTAPAQQTVTTSCHHCVDPACMKGCPVKAYEKDPVTGIVKHLDDQCIGCQYCTLMCPYDAPKYSHSRGIVRKCDMCSDRLSSGEAPACVQACPNGAIRITVVDQTHAVEASEAGTFLPGAPAPDQTIPTIPHDDEVVQALLADRSDEPLRHGVAVRTLRRCRHALYSPRRQQSLPSRRVQRVSVVDNVRCFPKEPSTGSRRPRATCSSHLPSGFTATPAISTARDLSSMTT